MLVQSALTMGTLQPGMCSCIVSVLLAEFI